MHKYYDILGVEYNASSDEIKEAYRDLVKVWHHDRFENNVRLKKKANEKLQDINDAYQKLINDNGNTKYKSSSSCGNEQGDYFKENQENSILKNLFFATVGMSFLAKEYLGGIFKNIYTSVSELSLENVASIQLQKLGYRIKSVQFVGTLDMGKNHSVYVFIYILNSQPRAYLLSQTAEKYIIYDTDEDMKRFESMGKMDVEEAKNIIREDFKHLANFEFPLT